MGSKLDAQAIISHKGIFRFGFYLRGSKSKGISGDLDKKNKHRYPCISNIIISGICGDMEWPMHKAAAAETAGPRP